MEAIIASILGGLVSGLFTFLGVWLTIRHENKKALQEELKRQKEKEEQLFENRPRLEIMGYKKLTKYSSQKTADACILLCSIKEYKNEGRAMFYYDESIIKPENWVCVEYTLRNTGHTEIDHIYFSTNLPKNTALFDVLNEENVTCYENNILNYSVIFEKTIKPQQTVVVRVCYIRDKIVVSNTGSAPITIWMIDEKKNWWSQPLFAPDNKICNSTKASHKEWKDYTSVETAIKCFENPMLW